MTLEILLALTTFAFVSSITPGPNNLMLMTSGVNFGILRTIPHMLGVALGFMLMVFLVGIGLVQLFDTYPISYTILKIVSIAYLLYLAWKIAMTRKVSKLEGEEQGTPMTFMQAALFQWVNPKAWTMALTAITVYAPQPSTTIGVTIVAVIFGLVNLPSVSVWAYLGQEMSRFLGTPTRVRAFNISAALLLVASLYPLLTPAT
ncbi:LysE family translocator [Cochlodiniinecator piscidefendens]|uniref:LysE family translocator n=1 Tax=Cochlodiniinecator piscidefendens TaxID=2715756 RepID=UPI00140C9BA2|nr:LysE family translocator [Cochlodiniinecator piscidefendens]